MNPSKFSAGLGALLCLSALPGFTSESNPAPQVNRISINLSSSTRSIYDYYCSNTTETAESEACYRPIYKNDVPTRSGLSCLAGYSMPRFTINNPAESTFSRNQDGKLFLQTKASCAARFIIKDPQRSKTEEASSLMPSPEQHTMDVVSHSTLLLMPLEVYIARDYVQRPHDMPFTNSAQALSDIGGGGLLVMASNPFMAAVGFATPAFPLTALGLSILGPLVDEINAWSRQAYADKVARLEYEYREKVKRNEIDQSNLMIGVRNRLMPLLTDLESLQCEQSILMALDSMDICDDVDAEKFKSKVFASVNRLKSLFANIKAKYSEVSPINVENSH